MTGTLGETLLEQRIGAANIRADLVEIFSELVNNAAFDAVIVDSGAGIRATLARNPAFPRPETDAPAIGLAARELVSGAGLLTMHGAAEPELRETQRRQGTMARLTIPA